MATRSGETKSDLYQDNSKIKWIALGISVLISIGSIYYTKILVDQLKEREKQQVILFAKAIEYTANSGESSLEEVNFIAQEILFQNSSIPIIQTDDKKNIIDFRNIDLKDKQTQAQQNTVLLERLASMADTYEPIRIPLRDPTTGEVFATQYIYYENSFLLTQIILYPYLQLSVIAIFGFIAYLAFNYSKAAEQNRVWVGLAKETAHQLGTPLSSLMAWIEMMRDNPDFKDKEIIAELEKDTHKLSVVTERFSSIGSVPTLKSENIVSLVNNVINYLRPRVSSKIKIEVFTLSENIQVKAHAPLFEWVIENLCKNAVDALGNQGTIAVKILRGGDRKVFIDISDTGKGIPRSKVSMIFKPGFTTKKRGWGLGLALAKRIIESYHDGKIFVKSTEENQGTTFRIALNAG